MFGLFVPQALIEVKHSSLHGMDALSSLKQDTKGLVIVKVKNLELLMKLKLEMT